VLYIDDDTREVKAERWSDGKIGKTSDTRHIERKQSQIEKLCTGENVGSSERLLEDDIKHSRVIYMYYKN
jgi:hypothetical protein